jgi:polysaccharide export outer membrane protein
LADLWVRARSRAGKWLPFIVGFAYLLAGLGTDAAEPPASTQSAKTTDSASSEYRLGSEDIVEVAVWKEDALKKELVVRPDGMISFPLIGEVRAADRTATEVRDEVTQRLRKYLSAPVVSVTVLRVAAQKIYVIGRVNKPGDFTSGRYIDVLQALSMAGGLTPFASANDIRIMRRENGKQVILPFRYSDVVKGNKLEQNIILKPGDVVVVP